MLETREKATPGMFGELLRNASMGDLRSCPVRHFHDRRVVGDQMVTAPQRDNKCSLASYSEPVWSAAQDGSRPPQQSRDHHHRPGLGLGAVGPRRGRHSHPGDLPASRGCMTSAFFKHVHAHQSPEDAALH